jgi:predicted N-acetyltransferase YhbS
MSKHLLTGAAKAGAAFVSSHVVDVCVAREAVGDASAREALLERAFGPGRHLKTSARMRIGHSPAEGLSLVARDGVSHRLVGTVRLWAIAVGNETHDDRRTLLLGPLGVDPAAQGHGIGCKLMRFAIAEAAFQGYGAIILVGDPAYYERFGFSATPCVEVRLPGPVEQRRLLGLDLRPGTLAGVSGLVRMTGAPATLGANDAAELDVAV